MNTIGKTIGLALCAASMASCVFIRGHVVAVYCDPQPLYATSRSKEPMGEFSIATEQDYFVIVIDLKESFTTKIHMESVTLSGTFILQNELGEERQRGEMPCEISEPGKEGDAFGSFYRGFYYENQLCEEKLQPLNFHSGKNELKIPLSGEGWRLLLDGEFHALFVYDRKSDGKTLLSDDFYHIDPEAEYDLGSFSYYYKEEPAPLDA